MKFYFIEKERYKKIGDLENFVYLCVSGQATSDRAKNEQTILNKIWTQEKEPSTTFLTETEF